MNLIMNLVINLYSLILLIIIYVHSNKHFDKDMLNDILFNFMILITGLMLVVDVLSRFDGKIDSIYPIINQFGNFAIFFLSPILPSLWLAYVHYEVFDDADRTKKLKIPLILLNASNVMLLLLSQFNGWYYFIDKNNIYHRGPYYFVSMMYTLVLIFFSSVLIILYRNKIKKTHYSSLFFFILSPIVSMALQIFFYGFSLILHGVVVSMLILLLNIQNKDLSLDYLTKIHNRKKIDRYIKKKIRDSKNGIDFSAMILDINNFKRINDQYGHDEGDKALQTVAKLLKEFVGRDGFVGRFGGDEFYIVLDKSQDHQANEMAMKIKQGMVNHNKMSTKPYQLELSVGYAVYKGEENLSLELFQKKIDDLMYKDKNRALEII